MEVGFKGIKSGYILNVDGSLTVVGGSSPNSIISVNQANNFAWTGSNSWSGASTFNSTVGFNSTANFFSAAQFFSTIYNFGTFYNGGSMYFPTWPTGAIPFINESNFLSYETDDFYRFNTIKKYGFGIGVGETPLAKVHFVGGGSCSGTPRDCSTFSDSGSCNGELDCNWQSYGSCGSFGDSDSCNAQQGCLWSAGTACSSFGNADDCNAHSPCFWDTDYSSCSVIGDEGTCNAAGGGGYCSWAVYSSNTCPGFGDPSSCNSNPPCSWNYQPCSDFNNNEVGCDGQNPNCTFTPETADCSIFNDGGGDGTLCGLQPTCSYDSGTGVCSGFYPTGSGNGSCDGPGYGGSCGGDNTTYYCSGDTYPTGTSCHGDVYGAGCQESFYCGGSRRACTSYTDQGTCQAQLDCVWAQDLATYHDGGAEILQKLILSSLPTSASGLASGQVWNNSGILHIV